jgi:glycosyltransferase involved in cell wall biosynthesis
MRRVGIDAHVLDGKFQGSRTYLENILPEIGRLDRRNRYVIYSFDPDRTRAAFDFPSFEHRRISVHAAIPRLLAFWPWACRRDRLDVLLTQYVAPPLATCAQFVVIHDLLFESHPQFFPPPMRWRLRLLCRLSAWRARAVFTVSDFAAAEIKNRYHIRRETISITPDAVRPPAPLEPEAAAQAAALQPYLLCVGRLEPRKNVGLALAATEAARAAGTRLVVVGREDFYSIGLARQLAASPNVIHLRDVPPALLAALYRHALALIYPSFGEGFGIPVLEALSHGTPVLASDRTAIPEAGGTLALYFSPERPDAIAALAALIGEVQDGQHRPHADAIAEHLARFQWSQSAATIIDAIDRLR